MLGMIELAVKDVVYMLVVSTLFGVLVSIVSYDECANLQGGWVDQCRGVVHTTDWGVKAIEAASDMQPFVKQTKHALDVP